MNPGYEVVNIVKFLVYTLTFKEFCFYFRHKFGQEKGRSLPDLSFEHLAGDRPRPKAEYLVDELERHGYLTDLVFHLTSYWFDELHEEGELFLKAGLRNDLCIAAQELWRSEEDHRHVIQAFDWLATIHKRFGQEWKKEDARTALEKAPSIGAKGSPNKSVDELADHLKECRERYTQAFNDYENHQYQRAREKFIELDDFQPDYRDVLEQVSRIDALLLEREKLYAQATGYREAHQWLKARETFIELDELQPNYRDVPDWVRILGNEDNVRRLQKLIDAAQTGFVYDDRLPWEADYPYRLFQTLGTLITPGSSMDDVQKELVRLSEDEQVAISPEQRASMETLLKSEGQRLFADAFLYPVCPSKETALSIMETFLEHGQLPTSETIVEQYPEDAAVTLFLLGSPEEASALWETAQHSRPSSGRLAHCQGLLYLGQAYGADAQDMDAMQENWRQAISHWAVALADTAYWIKWGQERSRDYDRPFVFASIGNLGPRLRDYLARLLLTNRERLVEDGETALAEDMGQLYQELAIEFEAVRLSQALGGIVLEPGKLAWFGPLWMAHFGLEEPLANHLATFVPDDSMANELLGRLSPSEALRRLRWYFSYLRTAAILLEGPDPDPHSALKALEQEQSKRKQAPGCDDPDCPLHSAPSFPVAVCCLHEDRFATDNPAYAGLEKTQVRDQMCGDALQLAMEARSQLARAQISDGAIVDLEALQSQWRELLALAEHSHDQAAIRERLRAVVLEETLSIPSDVARLNASITLNEISLRMLSSEEDQPPEDQALKNRLAELLDNRGITKLRQGDVSGAEADLRRALAVAPHNHGIRTKLANMWTNLASNVVSSDRFLALNYLRRAVELIEEGQEKYPGFNYDELLQWIEDSRENLIGRRQPPAAEPAEDEQPGDAQEGYRVWRLPRVEGKTPEPVRLYGQGIRALREGRPEQALKFFDRALALNPEDVDVQAGATEALLASAWQLIDQGDREEEGLALFKAWMPRLPMQEERLARQMEFLKWWPNVQLCLKRGRKELPRVVHDYQEVRLPFEAKNANPLWVRVRVEGDNLCVTAPLPTFPESEAETVLCNLLVASQEIMLFKIAAHGESELRLRGLVPLDQLDPDWFILTTFELSGFADVSRDQLVQMDTLRTCFREARATYVQEIQDSVYLSTSGRSVETVCEERDLSCNRLTDVRYDITASFGPVEMEAWLDGVRLATRLGPLRETPNRQEALRNLAALNATFTWSKLALDAEDADVGVILSVELPYLEGQLAYDAFDLLERRVAELKPQLVK